MSWLKPLFSTRCILFISTIQALLTVQQDIEISMQTTFVIFTGWAPVDFSPLPNYSWLRHLFLGRPTSLLPPDIPFGICRRRSLSFFFPSKILSFISVICTFCLVIILDWSNLQLIIFISIINVADVSLLWTRLWIHGLSREQSVPM